MLVRRTDASKPRSSWCRRWNGSTTGNGRHGQRGFLRYEISIGRYCEHDLNAPILLVGDSSTHTPRYREQFRDGDVAIRFRTQPKTSTINGRGGTIHGRTHTLLRTLFAASLLAGCRDVTAPALAPPSRPGFNMSGEHASAVAMPCELSVQSTRGAKWKASRTSVTFPVPTLSPENRTIIYFVRGYNDRREITAVAACVIPATPAAVEWIGRAFKVTKVQRGFDPNADGGVTIMSGEPAFALEPLWISALDRNGVLCRRERSAHGPRSEPPNKRLTTGTA